MKGTDDRAVWDYAKANGFVLASKDGDFHQFGLLLGPPPQVIWLRVGNSSTSDIEALLRASAADAERFAIGTGAVLVIGI